MNTHPLAGGHARLKVNIRRKSFDAVRGDNIEVLRDLRFEVGRNEFVCLVGPSGCGKSTTLRILLGLDHDYDGDVEMAAMDDPQVGVVFQEPLLLPWRTVEQNVRLALDKGQREKNLDTLFGLLGLAELREFYPSELSLGLARRAALARALAIDPDLLVLDEPFVSLDETVAQQLRQLLVSVWMQRPTTVVMVTHNLREAMMLSDRIIVLAKRPTHVAGSFVVGVPRENRSEPILDELLNSFRHMFRSGV